MLAVQISTLRRRRRRRGLGAGGPWPGGTAPGGGLSGDGLAGSTAGSADATPGPESSGGIGLPIDHSTRLPRPAKITIPRPRINTPMDMTSGRGSQLPGITDFLLFCLIGTPWSGPARRFERLAGSGGGTGRGEQAQAAVGAVRGQREPGVSLHVGQAVQHVYRGRDEIRLLRLRRELAGTEVGQAEFGQPDRLVIPVVDRLQVTFQLAHGRTGAEVAAVPVQGDEVDPVAAAP